MEYCFFELENAGFSGLIFRVEKFHLLFMKIE